MADWKKEMSGLTIDDLSLLDASIGVVLGWPPLVSHIGMTSDCLALLQALIKKELATREQVPVPTPSFGGVSAPMADLVRKSGNRKIG